MSGGRQDVHAPRRVLMIHEPPDGGVAEHVFALSTRLRRHGWESVVAGPRDSSIRSRLSEARIETLEITGLARGFARPDRDLRACVALRRAITAGGFTIVHCHASKAGLIGRVAALGVGVPVLYSPHCFGFIGPVRRVRRLLVVATERLLTKVCRRIICVSDAERARALQYRVAAAEKLTRINYGVDSPSGDAQPVRELAALASNGPLVGAISVLRPQKRLDVLLDAVPAILSGHPTARVVIVGNGPLRPQLEAQARALGLDREPRFRFMTFTPPSHRYLLALDVFVLASDWEGMPIAILEALACGVPQVVTAIEGSLEAATSETARFFPPGDAGALATEILLLLGAPDWRAEARVAARARHQRFFRTERMVQEVSALYDRVARVAD